jgi:hypothetical protein
MYEPSYLSMDRVVTVETARLRPSAGTKLVWAGMSSSTNPKMVMTLIKDLSSPRRPRR